MIEVKCSNPDCNKTVKIYPYRLKETKNFFCSKECRTKFNSRPRKPQITVKCDLEGCENTITMTENEFKQSKHHFCSKKCHDEFKKNRVKVICAYEECKQEFEIPKGRYVEGRDYFCCVEHHNLFMSKKVKVKCDLQGCENEFELPPNKFKRSEKHYCCFEHFKLAQQSNEYEIFDDYAELIINSNKHGQIRIKIDLDDVEKVKQRNWTISYNQKLDSWYVQNITCKDAIYTTTLLHRYIMDCPKDMEVDHVLHDFRDCRKKYLKIVTREENVENRRVTKRSTTGILNVYPYGNKYQVGVTKNGVRHNVLGIDTIDEAKEIAKGLRNELMTNNVLDRLDEDKNND